MGRNDISVSIGAEWVGFQQGIKAVQNLAASAVDSFKSVSAATIGMLKAPPASDFLDVLEIATAKAAELAAASTKAPASAVSAAQKTVVSAWKDTEKLGKQVAANVTQAWKTAVQAISNGFKGLTAAAQSVFANIVNIAKGAFNLIVSLVQGAFAVVKNILSGIFNIISTAIKGIIAVGAALAGVFALGISHSIKTGAALFGLSRASGVAVRDIELLRHALAGTETSAADAAEMLAALRDNFQVGRYTDLVLIVKELDLNFDKLQRMSLPDQFALLAERVNQISNPILRAAYAARIFGDAGAKAAMISGLDPAKLKQARDLFGRNAEQVAAAAKAMFGIKTSWERIKEAGGVFFSQIATRLAPIFDRFANAFVTIIVPAAEKLGNILGAAFERAANIFIGMWSNTDLAVETLQLGLALAVEGFKNLMIRAVIFIGKALVAVLTTALSVLQQPAALDAITSFAKFLATMLAAAFSIISSGDFWAGAFKIVGVFGNKIFAVLLKAFSGLATLVLGLGDLFATALLAAFAKLVAKIPMYGEELNKALGTDVYLGKDMGAIFAERFSVHAEAVKSVSADIDAMTKNVAGQFVPEAIENMMAAFNKVVAQYGPAAVAEVNAAFDALKKLDLVGPAKKAIDELGKQWNELVAGGLVDPQKVALFKLRLNEFAKLEQEQLDKFKPTETKAQGGKNIVVPTVQQRFDELRRVGSGIAAGAGIASSIPQRQLDALHQIRDILGKPRNASGRLERQGGFFFMGAGN